MMTAYSYEQIMGVLGKVSEDLGRIAQSHAELVELQKETDRRFQDMRRTVGDLTSQWGLFIENYVVPACERIFDRRGISIDTTMQHAKSYRRAGGLEIDVIAYGSGQVVAIRVKADLDVEAVNCFLEDLQQFREFFPEYADWKIYGAVAGMRIEDGADRYAYRQGLFVLAQSGDTVQIMNDEQFKPKAW